MKDKEIDKIVQDLMDSVGTVEMEYTSFYKKVQNACIALKDLQQWKNNAVKELDSGLYGWTCPRCLTIQSPFVQQCSCLPNMTFTYSDSTK